MTDTIFALSSGHGKAGVAVVRVSGADLRGVWDNVVRPVGLNCPPQGGVIIPRHAYLADLIAAGTSHGHESREIIDRAIAIYFAAPNSFTGEDVCEFHTHGSAAVTEKLFDTLRANGARMAEPGEFTRRAFNNGKMDLVEVDGLVALLDSRTDAQRRAALRSAAGADSAVYENWRSQMCEIAAYSAAQLDYPADELPENIGKKLLERTKNLYDEISGAILRARAARAVRAGFNIAIIGPVNSGKSSLFNRLVGESRAIVSDIPGTTRDVVSAELDIDGYLVRLLDTAGLRKTRNLVEKLGIARTQDAIETADLVIRVFPSCGGVPPNGGGVVYQGAKSNEIIVYNKCDMIEPVERNRSAKPPRQSLRNCHPSTGGEHHISALTGAGIPELLEIIRKEIHARLDGAESEVIVNARAKVLLEEAAAELANSKDHTANMDLFAEHVRRAADAIGRILGVIGAEEVMDATFGQLCLGK